MVRSSQCVYGLAARPPMRATASQMRGSRRRSRLTRTSVHTRSEEHTSELQSRFDIVCRLLLEKKTMTLLGLALAVGMLVDDATVEVENTTRNLGLGLPLRQALLHSAQDRKSTRLNSSHVSTPY